MVCPNEAEARDRLEALYHSSPSISIWARLSEFLGQIATAVVVEVTRDRSSPRISKFYTVEGKAFWHVFDPKDGQRFTFLSELEIREWLEHRYAERGADSNGQHALGGD